MAGETMKGLREKAEAALEKGVGNKSELLAAVPALVALQSAAKAMKKRLDETKEVIDRLSEMCSDYAHAHPEHVFSDSFSVSPIGVESGDLVIDGRNYHFSNGFDGYQRSDPAEKMTQEFLEGLPEGWAKTKLELDKTAINKAKPSEEELAEAGLERKPKRAWCEF